MPKQIKKVKELKDFHGQLLEYFILLRDHLGQGLKKDEVERGGVLSQTIGLQVGYLGKLITELTGIRTVDVGGKEYDMWVIALKLPPDKLAFHAVGHCVQVTNRAIGQLLHDIEEGIRDKHGNVIGEPSKDAAELPVNFFDKMKFHPRVIEVSENLFKTGNYAQAIFEAFKAVNNYVKEKTGLTLDGTNLMEKVFNENKPILQLNELLDKYDKDEQTGFKFLFMGSQMGIRNPKAHKNVKQEDPRRTLEYLNIASLLMRRVDESKLVKLNIEKQKA